MDVGKYNVNIPQSSHGNPIVGKELRPYRAMGIDSIKTHTFRRDTSEGVVDNGAAVVGSPTPWWIGKMKQAMKQPRDVPNMICNGKTN